MSECLAEEPFDHDPYIVPAQHVADTFATLDRVGGSVEALFSQAKVWVDQNGVHHQLDEMPISYLCAVQKFIENRVMGYRYAIGNYIAASLTAFGGVSDHVADEVLAGLDEDEERPDVEWLAEQPLYRRISDLLGDRRFETEADQ